VYCTTHRTDAQERAHAKKKNSCAPKTGCSQKKRQSLLGDAQKFAAVRLTEPYVGCLCFEKLVKDSRCVGAKKDGISTACVPSVWHDLKKVSCQLDPKRKLVSNRDFSSREKN
jgi:hypothetical protein